MARRAFAFDEGEPREVQAVAPSPRRLRAYRLRGARTREERAAEALAVSGEAGLFGRSMEIQALVDVYKEVVASRRSATMALFGELGVGETAEVGASLGSFHPDPRLLRVLDLKIDPATFRDHRRASRDFAAVIDPRPALRRGFCRSTPLGDDASQLVELE